MTTVAAHKLAPEIIKGHPMLRGAALRAERMRVRVKRKITATQAHRFAVRAELRNITAIVRRGTVNAIV